jgi:hypothetical protein
VPSRARSRWCSLRDRANLAPNNAGPILAWDFVLPVVLLVMYAAMETEARTRAASRDADPSTCGTDYPGGTIGSSFLVSSLESARHPVMSSVFKISEWPPSVDQLALGCGLRSRLLSISSRPAVGKAFSSSML